MRTRPLSERARRKQMKLDVREYLSDVQLTWLYEEVRPLWPLSFFRQTLEEPTVWEHYNHLHDGGMVVSSIRCLPFGKRILFVTAQNGMDAEGRGFVVLPSPALHEMSYPRQRIAKDHAHALQTSGAYLPEDRRFQVALFCAFPPEARVFGPCRYISTTFDYPLTLSNPLCHYWYRSPFPGFSVSEICQRAGLYHDGSLYQYEECVYALRAALADGLNGMRSWRALNALGAEGLVGPRDA